MAKQNKTNSSNALRIIGGKWRGRKLTFPDAEGLRPTGDRIRETLFNWLQPVIGASRCLDLFAGSGALGFEAASRGAEKVVMIETDNQAFSQIKQHKTLLSANQVEVMQKTAEQFLSQPAQVFDVVFVDPPYQANLWSSTAQLLTEGGWLRAGTQIYVEYPRQQTQPDLPESWHLLREKQAGDVTYCLFEFQSGAAT